ncbi:ATP-binding cassette sub-family A member 2 isoform X2 [Apteryx mantelli]|uniref:ATP-binding cassette sub-family A member 2 isoform X2 n=1 Tax=Apteryx mantelli TaxID=2696672 RepID=A0ABM4FKP7_9AVES
MGFLHQLHLLLWKNVTLKRRSPWVLAFEIFIPLVLFFILLGLRQKKPTIPVKEAFYTAAPLTSAGILPVMQSLCPDGQRDEFGFLQYSNSTVTQLLEHLSEVVEQSNLFDPDHPGLEEELESLRRRLEALSSSEPSSMETHFSSRAGSGFTLAWAAKDRGELHRFLTQNLSLPNSTANLLLGSSIDLQEVYHLYFGSSPLAPDDTHERDLWDRFGPSEKILKLEKSLPSGWRTLREGLIHKALRDPSRASHRQTLLRLLSQALGLTSATPGPTDSYNPQAFVTEMENIIFTAPVLEHLTCDQSQGGLRHLLRVAPSQQALLQAYRVLVCNGSQVAREERFTQLATELKDQLDSRKIVSRLKLDEVNSTATQHRLHALLEDLMEMEKVLRDMDILSALAKLLPKGACASKAPPPTANSTSWASGNTTAGSNTTAEEESDGEGEPGGENPQGQFSAFVQLWAGLQPILCGNNRTIEPEALKQGNMSSLGFTSKEQRNLGLLVHLMTSNPKILYAPVGTEVDKVILKANETFAFVGNVTHYAKAWMNISPEIRAYLEEGRLQRRIHWLQQFMADLHKHPEILNVSDSDLLHGFLNGNFSLPNASVLLQQLDTIDNAACGWVHFMAKVSVDIFKGFPDEESIVNYTLNQAYQDNVTVFASVIFQTNKDGSLPPHVMYKIRQNSSFTEKTNEIRRAYWRPGPNTGGRFYFLYGFVWIQDMMERALINTFVGHDVVEPGNYVQMFPYPCYTRDDFLFVIEHMMPLCMVISWVYSVAMMIQHIVTEKEHRLKEVMKMMGLNNAVHWVAWFITGFVQLSISVTALTAILKYGKVLMHSDVLIIWLFLAIYAVATIMFCFLVSVLYSKAKLASACGGIIYFLSYVPYMYVAIREEVAHDKITAFEKCIASLMSTTAFGLGSKYFALYEVAGVGIQWHTFSQSPVEGDDFNLLLSMMMLSVDAVVYGVLTWYIEAVHPGMYGLPRPWYFPFQKSYWLGNGRVETWEWTWPWSRTTRLSIMEEDQACAMESRRLEETRGIEEEPSHLPLVVCIDKLTKVYKTDKKLALNKLSLNLYENQVVSFLGHNGAGKTTTMSILTGLFPPTSGSATIYGHDIRTEMDEIRKNLGMCPQHNVLFDRLTVEEHLWFYSQLKSMAEEEIRKEMDKMIEDLELSNKRHSLVQTLSGGMKRKLSVAIAFVGGSRAVILDEPTAGVDPYARRAIWDLILKYKPGRTILLSTHHMDEADLLGDRIAIISHGKLKCCGSPLFLKSTYGDGYKLTVVKRQSDTRNSTESGQPHSPPSHSSVSPCSEPRVSQFIKKYVASCLLISDTNTELSYILPSEAVKKGCFERLFQHLEQSLEELDLTSFGLMDTTLEEVFLKVSEEDQSLENSDVDMKESKKDALRPPAPDLGLKPEANGEPLAEAEVPEKPEVELSNLVTCSKLAQSQASLRSASSVGSVRGDEGGAYSEFFGDYSPLFDNRQDPDNISLQDQEADMEAEDHDLAGQGSFKLEGSWLKLRQFHGLIVKRFHCAKRNTKALFSQILLPAFFVCVAMTVALSVPEIGDLPPLILSPSQYHNYTQPKGNFIPYANEERREYRIRLSPDASPQQLVNTFHLPSGVGATCVLKTAFNNTLDQPMQTLNLNSNESKMLAAKYFDAMCIDSFTQGLPLSNFVPPPPSPAPSDYPISVDEDLLRAWNSTTFSSAIKETITSAPTLPRIIHEPIKCTCSMQGTGFSCPSGVGGHPPQMKVVTGDILADITGRNVSEYLLYTSDRFRLHRYGALTFGNVQKSIPASFGARAPATVRKIAVRRTAQVFYNNKGYHSMPTYLNALNNAILRANLPKSKGNPAAYGITVTNHPMNKTSASLSLDYLLQGTDVVIAIFIIVAMSFVPASFVVFLVAEKATKAKHLQFVSGCDPVIYWLANYVWDMLNYLVPATCCIIILFVFDLPAYTSPTNFPAVLSLFLLYGWSITPIMYPASFWFEVPSSAYVFLIVINLFIGITATVATFLLQLFEHDKDLKVVNSYLKSCFLVFPNYNLGHGLMEMAYNEYINEYYAKIGQFDKMKSPFEWDIVTRGLVAMTIEGFVGFFITIMCQYNFFRKPQRLPVSTKPIEDDIDVANERHRVLRGDADNDMLKIENLTKVYKSRKIGRILAVDRLCVGVRPGECFGLLGVNGAGKTTTFKMLTGDESTTGGEAFVNGHSILKELLQVQQSLGYCPQFDALFDELTAQEHLELYTRLRGIPWKDEERVCLQAERVCQCPEDWCCVMGCSGNDLSLGTEGTLSCCYLPLQQYLLLAEGQGHPSSAPTWGAGAHRHLQLCKGLPSELHYPWPFPDHAGCWMACNILGCWPTPQGPATGPPPTASSLPALWPAEAFWDMGRVTATLCTLQVVKWALKKLELTKYADKPASTYSGGNKRKLSTAIALIGYPSFIFLDEPTTGMDPKARRFLWNLILDVIKTGRSVVLTSHSMEECEALCTRLAIMVNGRLKCLGSIQHLKNRFGDGYMITVRTKSSLNVKEVVRFFNRNFPEAILKERHHTKTQYQLKSDQISLAQVFSKMEQVVDVLGIEDYSVSQTTLDNVFVNFAKKQSDNLEQQETSPSCALQSPLERVLSLLRPRAAPTELRALVVEEQEDLETDDEGLISFEEERAQLSFNTDTLC